jgi:hypothetical protein
MIHIKGYDPSNPGITFAMERLTPDFKRLCIGIGYFLRRTEQWCLWEALVNAHGYERVIAALGRCEANAEGFKNYNTTARICMEMKRMESLAEKQAAQDAANAAFKTKPVAKARLVKVGEKWVVEEKV